MIESIVNIIKDLNGLEAIMYLLIILISIKTGYTDFLKKVLKKNNQNNPLMTKHIIMIADIDKLISEKISIIDIRILKDQMREVETSLDSTIRELKDRFFQKLLKLGLSASDILENITYKHYSACTEILYTRLSKDIKYMLKENGLHIKTEIDMRSYLQTRFEKLLDIAEKTFDVYYCGAELKITRMELHDIHQETINILRQRFENTIRTCREIDIKYHKRIAEIESEIEKLKLSPCGDCV